MPAWSWGRNSELPKSFEGKSPEDIEKELTESRDLKAKLDKSETDLTELKTKFESFSSDFDQKLDARFATVIEKLKPAPKETQRQEMADFLTEPDRAFAERSAPVAALAMNTAGYVARNAAKEKMQRAQRANPGKNFDGYFFEKFEDEIAQLARTVPAQQLTNPDTWEHIYFNVKGRHAEEIAAQMNDGSLAQSIESGGAGARAAAFEGKDKETPLTDQEKRLAEKLGVTPENWALRKKEIGGGVGINV